VVCGQISKNMTKAFFYDLNAINAGASRPDGHDKYTPRKVAVLGAGMMGAGIAYVCALSGWEVVLKDVSLEAAEKGKIYSEGLVAKAVKRGRTTLAKGEALLERITPTADYNDLAGCDVVIEAVFESVALKQEVFREAMKVIEPDALLCSNTSTLPITELAAGIDRPGSDFFEPGGPHCRPLPWLSSQFSRAPIIITTSLSANTVERAAAADSGCVSGSRPLAMLIGMYGMPLFSISARMSSSACA